MTSEKRAQKFYSDDVSLSKSGLCFLLVEVSFPHGFSLPIRSTTQMQYSHVISMEFLQSFLRHHFAGKPVVASRNVGCFPQAMTGPAVDKSRYFLRFERKKIMSRLPLDFKYFAYETSK